jgi:ProP effector
MIDRLRARFPEAFSEARPLKIGITDKIIARLKTPEYSETARTIKAALDYWAKRPAYLAACVEGAVRIDLNGNAAGEVDNGSARYAREELEKLNNGERNER